MERLKNERGYALVIVLLIVVLFLGAAATFMAGSLNHVKQEVSVDTGNQAVAAAEMGTNYYSVDFERELETLKINTKLEAAKFISCMVKTDASCTEIKNAVNKEQAVDNKLKEFYFNSIVAKVASYPFGQVSGELVDYRIEEITFRQLNEQNILSEITLQEGDSTNAIKTMKNNLNNLEIELQITGIEDGMERFLTVTLHADIPENFVEALAILPPGNNDEEITILNDYLFGNVDDVPSCQELLASMNSNEINLPKNCEMKNMTLAQIADGLKSLGRELSSIKVHVKDLPTATACPNSFHCGLTLVADGDVSYPNNYNNTVNTKVFIDGKLKVGNNINNLGKNGSPQTFVMQELEVGSNIQNMESTIFMVLGKNNAELTVKDGVKTKEGSARLEVGPNVNVSHNAKFCIDLDQIKRSDWETLQSKVTLTGNGEIIYHSLIPSKKFVLAGNKTSGSVKGFSVYGDFLNYCGLSVDPFIEINPIDAGYELEVEY